MSSPMSGGRLVACLECDLLHVRQILRDGERATCERCGALLYEHKKDGLDRTISIWLTILVLFVLANVYPFMTFSLQGRTQESVLLTGVLELSAQGFWVLALVVFLASIAFPFVKISGMLYVLLPLKVHRQVWMAKSVFRLLTHLSPWAMTEVYMMGVFVAYVKLTDLADIVLGVALYAFAALIVCQTAAAAVFDPEEVWEQLEETS